MTKVDKFKKIKDAVRAIFEAVRLQWLPKGKHLNIGYFTSLGDLYNQSVRASGGTPSADTRKALEEVAGSYLDGAQSRLEANLKHIVTVVSASKTEEKPVDVQTMIEEAVDKASTEVETVVDTESQRARSVGAWEGITQAAAQMGIEDPTVFFVVVRDDRLCDECKRLHMQPNGITPRVWKLSEVKHEYHERGDPNPSVMGLHPHCRCTQTVLFPGFGFDSGGFVHYISPDWDEYAHQRGQSS